MALSGDRAFVADWNDARVFDIQKPSSPTLVATETVETGVTFPIGWDDSRSYAKLRQPGGISPFPLQVVVVLDGRIEALLAR